MKPSLQLKFSQQLTMTPQLQQAIKLLQLSTLDLQQEIQEALDSNPLLEIEEGNDEPQLEKNNIDNDDSGSEATASASSDTLEAGDALEKNDLPDELPIDSTWDEYYSASSAPAPGPSNDDEQIFQGETTEDIQEHLLWQMRLTHFSDTDRAIATAIIDSIDESGYLTVTLDDILEAVNDDDMEEPIEMDEVECVLKRIQMFDPIGSGSRSPQECLMVQLRQFSEDTPWLAEAKQLIEEYSDLLSSKDYRTLMRKSRLKEDQLREAMRLLQTLNPRPGSALVTKEPEYVIPDVSVTKKNGRWVVELNPDSLPKLSVNQQYAAMSRRAKNSSDSQFIRSHMQEAKWFIKSLESRNETLMKVANCIVQQQMGFFEHGPEMMKPMVLNDVAEMVDMHESTISRVTTQKYMHTPRGIFELKYFFSSHVATESGGECSSTAIRALIKKLVAAEKPSKPLSDSKIASLLAEQGIKVARRTIAKYRESLSIPPSNQRKSLI
ncbi:RNA polymerase sigma-54 factor [Alteromonas macleodii str. 'Black Sea 11']|jgi:RNA polymerase sigma-54 factor|uniref:RNA polymerase factor sigma-54 n=1 Tax=Alteromonas abrolhosensis TaxID=1892904 RepID=UPI000286F27E|nr:RNA polymerase factor sigma-54 [Alteromonas abrolhosensis]AFT77308.1 RNA polymerase sigma-54 factor [Alteromonas macleodii str. 'Black Sea 11']NKW88633.1 RNA polymerase factor sigma-54 [Alteromonadaceae bacterium A_SAG4]NKX05063.1 RNA polymerase factor sigma-54 [Alteromonadaceae bacterium A_SAG6]NKX18132.1 RNA polymerase factor sigma-54 [Alteromonadaceae bacterium A_SAG5]NKX35145.1 RNA polymerase factor sigma-54 [Alteromonadaceae bacterium A_SAG3]NKX69923.1 RNA polymerase factor sigma-54 [